MAARATVPSASIRDAMIAVVFVCLLAVPSVVALLGGAHFDPSLENRTAAPMPELRLDTLRTFPGAFEKWFGDHFGLRTRFVYWTSRAKVAMGVSPSPKVLIGRDGLLFYAGERSVELYQRTVPFTPTELSRWQTTIEQRHGAFARRGIRYVLFFPPNKESIYWWRMPEGLQRLSGPSGLDQLLGVLSARTSVAAVDLRPSIEQSRSDGPVYFATDTHWNGRGAFAGYRSVIGKIREWLPDARQLGDTDVSLLTTDNPGGDLAGMLGLRAEFPERTAVECRVLAPRAHPADVGFTPDPKTPPHLMPRAWAVDDPKLPSAVVLGDSFMAALVPLLAESFSRTLFLGEHSLPEALIDRESPDVVIEEWVERYIVGGPPANPEWIANAAADPPSLPRHLDEAHSSGEPLPPSSTWSGNEVSRVEGGLLQATGDDPYVETAVSPFDAEPSLTMWVPLRAIPRTPEQGGLHEAQLFWSVEGAPFTEDASLRFPILVDGAPHTYAIHPSFSTAFRGRVTSVRLDFPDLLPGARYGVGEVEISAPAAK